MRQAGTSLAPPIFWGVVLILVTVVLTVFWNVAVVTEGFRATLSSSRPLLIATGIAGTTLFAGIITGLVLFIVSLAKQIRLNQRQQNFIDSVTHELKSPLTSLKLHLETMQLRQLEPAVQQEFTRLMLQDVERLNALIDHVLEAAHVDQPRRELVLGTLALGPALAEAVAVVSRRHQLPPDAVTLEPSALGVRSDAAALQLVLVNLLENAVKYSQATVCIGVRAYVARDGRVAVAVSDTGVGIPRNQLKRIFKRFHRVGNELTRIRRGTGLGLYIVKETLGRVDGRIEAWSPGENGGSVFTLSLPAGEQPDG